jgi:hypothetical protein
LKSINNFGNLVKSVSEENSKIKPPTRDYTEIDLGKEKYRQRENHPQQRPKFSSNKVHDNDSSAFKESSPPQQYELQRPTFMNKNLENKNTNFVELNTQGDVILYYNLVIFKKTSTKRLGR